MYICHSSIHPLTHPSMHPSIHSSIHQMTYTPIQWLCSHTSIHSSSPPPLHCERTVKVPSHPFLKSYVHKYIPPNKYSKLKITLFQHITLQSVHPKENKKKPTYVSIHAIIHSCTIIISCFEILFMSIHEYSWVFMRFHEYAHLPRKVYCAMKLRQKAPITFVLGFLVLERW